MAELTHDWPGEQRARSQTIRRLLIRALVVEFAVLMGVAAVAALWPETGLGRGGAVLVLLGVGVILPVPVALLARRALAGVAALEAERDVLLEMYGRARLDSLLDGLTGLGNHRAFQEELARQLEGARRHGTQLALLLVDVDDLKKANDERGHAAGDELLAAVGRITGAVLRRGDRAFRVGGDEFAILLPMADVESGLAVGRRMLASALGGGDPGHPIAPFSLSIGVSAYPSPSTEGQHLYQNADAALYWCKRHGRTAVVAYDPAKHGAVDQGRSIADLSAAISEVLAKRSLQPVYQPIFSLTTGEPIGYEGLVRPGAGAPFDDAGSLFAAADVVDRSVELDLTCLEVIAGGMGPLEESTYLSVNLSPRTLESDLFHPNEIVALFRRRGIFPRQIVLELTEREEVEDLEQLRRNVAACRKAGFRLAADDVGAGNAGLRLLSEVHFDMVKIDLSLVQGGIVHDPSHGVLQALRELADRWHASIVAEGVETSEQLAVIRRLGIGAAQGYLLGRPSSTRSAQQLDLDGLTGSAWLDEPAA
jgi:diguanylate cyclase (GGDEF)-like protein